MRARTLARSVLFAAALVACKGGDDDSSSSSTGPEAHCSEGWGDGPEVDPNFPACGCAPERCAGGAACAADGPGDQYWISSVCLPPCKVDADCPTLGGAATKCDFDFCRLLCESDGNCPTGYVCSEGRECQVKLE